jgi:hypothetical protein
MQEKKTGGDMRSVAAVAMRASNSDLVAAITTLLCRESLALCSAFS